MKYISLIYLLLLPVGLVYAQKSTSPSKEELATFFATKNYQEIENKIQSDPLFSGEETPATLKAFEDMMYNIAFKNKALSPDDKLNIFKSLLKKIDEKSKELIKIARIGQLYSQLTKRRTADEMEQKKKLGISPEILGLELAVSFDSLPGVKLFVSHGADVKKTNALLQALFKEGDDLAIANYLVKQGATLEPFLPAGEKYHFEGGAFASFGLNPLGQIDEKISKRLMDYGLDLNKVGYYVFSNQPEKQGTILDLAFDMLNDAKQATPNANVTKERIAEYLDHTNKMITFLKKYGAKRSAELKK